MANRQEIIKRAREIITSYPSAGKSKVNQYLKWEYGKGLRSSTILELKREVAVEHPSLYPELYERGGVPKGLNEIYKGWIKSGFLPFEARELTVGHGTRYLAYDSQAVFDSKPGEEARKVRINWIRDLLRKGWTKQEIRDAIVDYYKKSKRIDPWTHIRAEYKPHKKVDYIDYRTKVRQRAKARQRRLLRKSKIE